uniref:Circularly permutated Ras protein 1-like protein n=1 Tax=Callorhinchus milii TaxID=7868 RepID=V9KS54_CALMI|eukprot:gi/632984176/ref/XP_007909010.1/ PREDICTED: circularly permutated Ras protein 1-like [Callorhinchus milii]
MPIYCTGCTAAVSSLSEIQDQPTTTWRCEYCGVSNPLDYRVEAGGARDDQTFLHLPDPASAQQQNDSLVVFCVDISGSMSVTLQVNPRADQQTSYMSRLQAVQEAVIQSFQYLLQTAPEKRVALVTFNDEVTVYGDGMSDPRMLKEFELMDQDYLKARGLQEPLPLSIAESKASLEQRVITLQEFGSTALGPASLISIAMASQKPGSKVIICTDGKANTALGNLEDIKEDEIYQSSKLFYQQLAEYAGQRGVIVSVLTIEGTDCRLQELGQMADKTGGKVNIVNPISLYNEFQLILEDDIIATNTTAIFVVNESLYFKHEGEPVSRLVRYVGNVTKDTEITFEFGIKEGSEQKIHQMPSLPFQLQLAFRLPDGRHGYRIVSLDRPTTSSSAIVKSNLNLAVLQIHSAQLSARLVMEGRLQEAQREALAQKELIEDVLGKRKDAEQEAIYESWVESMSPIHGELKAQSQDGAPLNPIYEPLNTRQNTAAKSFSDDIANVVFKLKNAKKKMFKKPKFLVPI